MIKMIIVMVGNEKRTKVDGKTRREEITDDSLSLEVIHSVVKKVRESEGIDSYVRQVYDE